VQVRTWIFTNTFFCGDFSKKKVYLNNPRSSEEVKHNIEQTVANTDPETLRKVVDACLREAGGHFQHLLQSCSVSSS
jgi:ketosteroid isomerase-like protein